MSEAIAYWGTHASEYNQFIVRVVPRYDEQLALLLAYAPRDARHVLELGCGSGNVSLRLVERWPGAEFTLVDGAPEMLARTRARLREMHPSAAGRMHFVRQQFESLSLEAGTIDVVVASLSLHHVADVSAVYERVAPALVRGGRLVMLDGIRGATALEHDVHMARWEAFWRENGRLSEEEIAEMKTHIAEHDHYRSLAEHFDMLGAAGFVEPDCVWRDGVFALVTATRG